jgi:CheY-like chemotaxis protein
VARHIKETPRLAHIPVVLLTGAFEPVDQAKAAAAGCDGVLAKPFEPQLVIGRVKELLARPRQRAPSLDAPPSPSPASPWTAPLIEPPPTDTAPKLAPDEVNQYFDRLDQAFASLSAPQSEAVGSSPPSQAVADSRDWFAVQPSPSASLAMPDRWDLPPSSPAPDLPLSYASPQTDFDRAHEVASPAFAPPHSGGVPAPFAPAQASVPLTSAPVQPGAPPALSSAQASASPAFDLAQERPTLLASLAPSPAPPPTLPPLADAFAALLAAEQSAPPSSTGAVWPASGPASVAVTDDVIEQVTRRVIDRLTDRVVRETVSEKILSVAERLVREEIDRIKSAIK